MAMHPGRIAALQVDAAGLAAAAALTAAAYFGALRPLTDARGARGDLAARQEAEERAAEELAASAGAVQRRLDDLTRQLEGSSLVLRPAEEINKRITALAAVAAECGLTLNALSPGQATPGARYGTVPVQLAGQGTYTDCAEFLRALHGLFRDTGVHAFDLAGDPGTPEMPPAFRFDLVWNVMPPDAAR